MSVESLQRLLESALDDRHAQSQRALSPLLEYDQGVHGDLVRTLTVYLRLGGNASRTAEALFLHRSGLLYRLRRIEDLLGVKLDNFEHRVGLEIAVLCLKRAEAGEVQPESKEAGE